MQLAPRRITRPLRRTRETEDAQLRYSRTHSHPRILAMHVARSTFLLIIAMAVCSAWASPSLEDERALRHIKEVDWPKAYREQDAQLLDRILAAEFQMIDADGVWSSKAEELEYIRKHKPSYESFRFVIKRLEIFDNDCAVVAGAGFISNRRGARHTVTEYQSTNIFIKRDGRWQAIASHVSGVKEQALATNAREHLDELQS